MFQRRGKKGGDQEEFWVEKKRLPKVSASTFYVKLEETLEGLGFAEGVREICRPAYAKESKGGRPGIDPAVYFKMLMIGFFENLPSERAIASRCADSLSLRAFLLLVNRFFGPAFLEAEGPGKVGVQGAEGV